MPLYRFVVHGLFAGADAPKGFYTTRWCYARNQEIAAEKVRDIICLDLKKESPLWTVSNLEIEESWRIRFWEIWRAPNRGYTFYTED